MIDKELARQRIPATSADLGYGGGNWTADIQADRVSVSLNDISKTFILNLFDVRFPVRASAEAVPDTGPPRRSTMSNETIPDPGRFQRQDEPVHEASGGSRALSALALVGLVVGVPVLLWLLAGSDPFPTSLPTKETLTGQLTFTTLLNVLLFVVWLAWVFFVVCVAVEIAAARRGGLAQPVPLGGPVQKLARALVGALLLAEVISGPAAGATTRPSTRVRRSRLLPSYRRPTRRHPETRAERRAAHEVTSQEHLVGHKVYTVAAPKDGYHDNLWDIAERLLGDGRRYREIYELNKGLVQPDGRKLELARLIQPGWNLVVPDDAVGVHRMTAPPTSAAPDEHRFDAGASTDTAVSEQGVQESPGGLLGTGLLAATALAALAFERRRRIGASAGDGEVEAELRGAATPSRAAFLDRALRDLMSACREASAPLPPVYAVRVDDDTVSLMLAPATAAPVGEWQSDDDGATWVQGAVRGDRRRWTARRSRTPPWSASASTARAATCSSTSSRPVEWSRSTATRTSRARSRRRSRCRAVPPPGPTDMRVTAAGLPAGLAGVGDDRIRIVDDLAAEVDVLERSLESVRADVLTGRLDRRTTQPSRLVVVGEPVTEELEDRLLGLTGPERQSLSVLVAGGHRAARWTLHVDSTGHLRVDALGITVTANRIGHEQVEGIAALFEAARRAGPSRRRRPGAHPRARSTGRRRGLDDGSATGRCARHHRRHRRTDRRGGPHRPARRARHLPRAAPRRRAPERARRRAVAARRHPGRERRRGRPRPRVARRRRQRQLVPARGRRGAALAQRRRRLRLGRRALPVPARPHRQLPPRGDRAAAPRPAS